MTLHSRIAAFVAAGLLIASPLVSQAAALVRVGGSTNPSAAVAAAARAFHAANPDVTVTVTGSSSGAGMAALRDGKVDAAMSDVRVSDPAFTDHVLGTLGIAFITGPHCGVRNLTRKQVIAIYSGKITNWKQLGGEDQPIVPFSRPIGTGTRFVFEQYVAKTLTATKEPVKAPDVAGIVAQTPGALAYVGTSFIDPAKDTMLTYEGVAPTPDNIRSHAYTFAADEHLYTRKDATPETRAFAAYVTQDRELLARFGIY